MVINVDYVELLKLYYGDKSDYRSEYNRRISSPDTVILDFDINSRPAFFMQNPEVSDLVFRILKSDKKVSMLALELPQIAHDQFTRRCLVDEIILTNKIEGVNSTRREIASIIDELEGEVSKDSKRKRFWGLVNRYYKLKAKEHTSLSSCEDLRLLYDELALTEVVAENPRNRPDGKLFRKDITSVYSVTDREVHRGVYPEAAIIESIKKALSFLNDTSVEQLYRISVFHYLLEYIHPFYDGNGRLGRFIVSTMLAQTLNPLLAFRISYTITENINRYYKAFAECNSPYNLGDVTPFLIMMLDLIRITTENLEEALRFRIVRQKRYTDSISILPGAANERTRRAYQLLIQAGLFSEHGISTREFTDNLGTSYSTAKNELDRISARSLLIRTRVGRENYYQLDLDSLDEMLLNSSLKKH